MINAKVKDIWNANAKFWDSKMGEGNNFHKTLIEPVQLKLLNVKQNDRILDVACGNGQFARKLNELGACVTAIDIADEFIELAKAKSDNKIDFKIVDASDSTSMSQFYKSKFDSVVCTMAMMDMENIESFIDQLPMILKKDGVFVFSILHPCFNSGETVLGHERHDIGGEVLSKYFVKVSNYSNEQTNLGVGMIGQPQPQYYFHRPISLILNYLFDKGFVLDGFLEPTFKDVEKNDKIFDNVYRNIPPALVCRLKLT